MLSIADTLSIFPIYKLTKFVAKKTAKNAVRKAVKKPGKSFEESLWRTATQFLGFVLANGSMCTKGEGEIRQKLVKNDFVDCMIARVPLNSLPLAT